MGSDKICPDDVGPEGPRLARARTCATPIQRWPSSFAAQDRGSEALARLGTDARADQLWGGKPEIG